MKEQQGAALVIVMVFLSGALLLGMSSMQSALIDERLAGNYRASTQAYMTSDNVLAALASDGNKDARERALKSLLDSGEPPSVNELIQNGTLGEFVNGLLPDNYEDLEEEERKIEVDKLLGDLDIIFEVNEQAQTITITSLDRGLRNSASGESSIVYRYDVEGANGAGLFRDGVITCHGANLTGGSGVVIDGFDSQAGAYGVGNNSGEKASLIAVHENSNLLFNMGAVPGVTGDIYSAGRMEVTNTMPIDGDVYVKGDISLRGNNALITGSLYSENNIVFHVGTRVDGDVSANSRIQVLGNWGEVSALQADGSTRAGTSYAIGGDATSPEVYSEIDNRISGQVSSRDPEVNFADFLSDELTVVKENDPCPDYGVEQLYEAYHFNTNPTDVNAFNYDGPTSTAVLGESKNINGFEAFHVAQLNIGGNGMVVERPTVIVAESGVDIALWGSSDAITLREGASLQVISKGTFSLKGSNVFDMSDFEPVVDVGGRLVSAFSFVSLHEGSESAIDMSSAGDMYGELLAPFGEVRIAGSARLMGRVFSNTLNVSGGASIHYDRAYADVAIAGEARNEQWCSFADISPLTVVSPVSRLSLPSSQAKFIGAGEVPDITVATGDAEKFVNANTANGNVREGIPKGVFDRGESAEKFADFIDLLRRRADITLNDVGKNNAVFGSVGNEKITFINGDVDTNNLSGAGILVVNGNYDGGGNPAFDGLLIVLGNYTQKGGGGRDLNGALLVAPYDAGSMEFSPANIEFRGGGSNDFNFDEQALRTAFNLLDEEEQESWGGCSLSEIPSDGLFTWSLIDWQ